MSVMVFETISPSQNTPYHESIAFTAYNRRLYNGMVQGDCGCWPVPSKVRANPNVVQSFGAHACPAVTHLRRLTRMT